MSPPSSRQREYSPLSPPSGGSSGDGFSSLMPPRSSEPEAEPRFEADTAEWSRLIATEPERPAIDPPAAAVTSRGEKDRLLLKKDSWLVRNGHLFTYVGLYLFSVMVLFRPYELIGGLGFLSATAFYFALGTLLLYVPSQFAVEGNLTTLSTEVKAIIALAVIALITVPIAKDPKLAWDTFNDPFIKAVIIFIVMVNVVRTRARLMGMMWLSLGIGIYLSITALQHYSDGKFTVESYRVAVEVGGLFGNPNDMSLHFVTIIPLALCLALGASSKAMRIIYFGATVLFIGANMVTYSRGGFIGFLAAGAVLAWKLGRKHRVKVSLASLVAGAVIIGAAPGNYGLRMLSIFIPGLDPVGSSDARQELLTRSLLVTARNPWGIGIGNFPMVGIRAHQTHNAYTQVSSEVGILGLIAYLVFIISPFRKLGAIERTRFAEDKLDWYYYLAIGLQASIIGYLASSFFASVAYNWFIYYLIAYAVAFRRLYQTENKMEKEEEASALRPEFAV